MSRPIETLDITLLRNNKNEFIVRSQRVISIIVKQYIATGMFSAADFDDIKQSVTLELIKRLPLIEKNYNGEVLLVTYLNVVIVNICLRIHHRESSIVVPIPLDEIWILGDENAEKGMLIANELERLEIALKLFRSKRFKLLVCLKVFFSIPISTIELKQCFRGITSDDEYLLLDIFKNKNPRKEGFAHFPLLASMLNKYERTSLPEESVLRWMNMMIQKLILLMNGNPPRRTHTKDTLRILLEYYSKLHANND